MATYNQIVITTTDGRIEGFINQDNIEGGEDLKYFHITGGKASIPRSNIKGLTTVKADMKRPNYRKPKVVTTTTEVTTAKAKPITTAKAKPITKVKAKPITKAKQPGKYAAVGPLGINESKPGSKHERCIDIITNSKNKDNTRLEHIADIMSTLNMTKPGASTYYRTAQVHAIALKLIPA